MPGTISTKRRLPAGSQKYAIGEGSVVGEPHGQGMRFEMIDGDQRLFLHEGDRLCRREADDETADQPRPRRRRDPVQIGETAARFSHRLGDQQIEHLHMRARGDLRHHAAEGGVRLDLRQHDIGQNLPASVRPALHHRRSRLVAGCLNAENDHCRRREIPPPFCVAKVRSTHITNVETA